MRAACLELVALVGAQQAQLVALYPPVERPEAVCALLVSWRTWTSEFHQPELFLQEEVVMFEPAGPRPGAVQRAQRVEESQQEAGLQERPVPLMLLRKIPCLEQDFQPVTPTSHCAYQNFSKPCQS